MDTELDIESNEDFYKNLLLGAAHDTQDSISTSDVTDGTFIVPQPGFVIKTKNEKDEKIFLNICTSDELPPPKEISEEELTKIIDDVDAMNFRVPIGLGNPHAEIDKSGKGLLINDKYREYLSVYYNIIYYTVLSSSCPALIASKWQIGQSYR